MSHPSRRALPDELAAEQLAREDDSWTIRATRNGSSIVALMAATAEPTVVGDRVLACRAFRDRVVRLA